MEIKTISSSSPTAFDSKVNQYLKDGWQIKSMSANALHTLLSYTAFLVKNDKPKPLEVDTPQYD